MAINSVTLCGRLTKDAYLNQYTTSSKHTFTIAVDKRVKKDGNWETVTNYFDIEAWNVGYLSNSLKKGRQVVVCGELDTSTYEKDGQKVKRIFIRADRIQTFGSASEKKEEPKKIEEAPYDPTWDMSDIP